MAASSAPLYDCGSTPLAVKDEQAYAPSGPVVAPATKVVFTISGWAEVNSPRERIYLEAGSILTIPPNQTFFTRIYLNEDHTLTADTAAPFESILDETTKQQVITWADQHTASNKTSDVVTQDLFLQARVTTSLIECARWDLNPHARKGTGT